MAKTQRAGAVRNAALPLVGVMLVALNLRPALTSVSPVLSRIGDSVGLSGTGLGILTTLPVLFLGLGAPLAPWGARHIGVDRTVLAAVGVLAMTLAARPYTGTTGLFIGTAIAGGCIGIMGVLLPTIVKRDFAEYASLLTGIYTAVLCTGASIAAGTTEPLRQAFDNWQPALAFWLVPALIALLIWWGQLGAPHRAAAKHNRPRPLWRTALAWQVTFYMGLQSSLAYTVFGWLPTILGDRGVSAVDAGLALSISIMIQISTAIATPWIGSAMRDQRLVTALPVVATLVGLGGCIYAPISGMWLWVVILGFGQGGTFSMALTLIAVRAATPEVASRLSGMAQGVGYTMAAIGPLLVGILHEASGSWHMPGILIGFIGIGALLAALAAGRDLTLHATPQ